MNPSAAYQVSVDQAAPQVVAVFQPMTQGNHRAMVIQTVCDLEWELAQLLFAFFTKQGTPFTWEQAEQELFGDTGLLGSLSKMTRLARYLALVDEGLAHDLVVLTKLRNMYAHGRERKQFYEDPKTAAQVERLILYQNSPALATHDHQGIYSSCFRFMRGLLQKKCRALAPP